MPFFRIPRFVGFLLLSVAGALAASSTHAKDGSYSSAELEQILAPIALYPDTVLSHILIASTYPLEVVQAERWLKENRDLSGEAAVAAVEKKEWDPSVKALVAFPQIIVRMSEDLDWTEQVGEAFLANETAVLASIQSLRQRAYAAGNLESLDHVRVEREAETIIIEPTVREVVYIPYYDTRVVYGDWHWHSHPPVYWTSHHRPHHRGSHFYWSSGVQVHPAFFFSSFHWDHYNVVVIDNHYWRHNPSYHSSREIRRHREAHPWQHTPRRNPRFERAREERRRDLWTRPEGRMPHNQVPDRPSVHLNPRPAGRPDWTDSRREIHVERPSGRYPRSIQTGEPRHQPRVQHRERERMPSSHRTRSVERGASPSQRMIRTMP